MIHAFGWARFTGQGNDWINDINFQSNLLFPSSKLEYCPSVTWAVVPQSWSERNREKEDGWERRQMLCLSVLGRVLCYLPIVILRPVPVSQHLQLSEWWLLVVSSTWVVVYSFEGL
jgi:hypothetical protein